MITKPNQGEDVRVLHKSVSELVDGINAFLNLTGRYEGKVRGVLGVGALQVRGGSSELTIYASQPGALLGGAGFGLALPTMSITSSKNPSKAGNPVFFRCSVIHADDGSTVLFTQNGVVIGTYPMSNQVAVTDPVTFAVPQNYNIRADFSGDTTHRPGFITMVQQVLAKPVPNITLLSSKNPSDDGEDIYFGVDMSDNVAIPPDTTPLPTGTVDIYHDEALYDTVTLGSDGRATTRHATDFSPGHNAMRAHYYGDFYWDHAEDTLDQIVKANAELIMNIQPGPTTQVGVAFIVYIMVRATGGGPTPTGQIDIHENGSTSGLFSLDGNGQASFSVAAGLPVGTYTWFFDYFGDGSYSQDFSPIYTQTVVPRAPTNLHVGLVGNSPYIGFRLYENWPPGLPGIFQVAVQDLSGGVPGTYTGPIGIQFQGIGGPGYVRLWADYHDGSGWQLVFAGFPNLYFNGTPMIGSTIELELVNGVQYLWISWNTSNWGAWDYNGPELSSGDPLHGGTSDFVFLRFYDPYDGSTIPSDFLISTFLDP